MFIEILERLSTALDRAGIPYMVIGGQAVLVYGEPRLTRDIDITLGLDMLTISMRSALSPWQLVYGPWLTPSLPVRRWSFPAWLKEGGKRQAIARGKVIRVGTADVRFATVEDLVIHKVLAGRPRDLEN